MKPMTKSIATVLRSTPPTYYRSLSISPVFTCITFIGIRPSRVAKKNFEIGTSRIGEDMLINQLGNKGVILKNRR